MWSLIALFALYSCANSQLIIGGIGDDISTGLSANMFDISTDEDNLDFPAQIQDQSCGRSNPARSWGAMIDSSYDGILSYAEQANAVGADNQGTNGASMLSSFFNQATELASFLRQSRSSRAIILLGHADMCTSQIDKVGSCQSADQDSNNYCRTTPQAFEREFRKGLDALITLNNLEIIVFAPLRYSQICNFRKLGSTVESLFGESRQCGDFWSDMRSQPSNGFGTCASLTSDCSNDRVQDAYNTQLKYFQILQTVSTNYKPTTTNLVVGNGTKVVFRDDLWNLQFQVEDISACDCFHPTRLMQSRIANITAGSLQCSALTPCCDANTPAICGIPASISGAAPVVSHTLLAVCIMFFLQLLR